MEFNIQALASRMANRSFGWLSTGMTSKRYHGSYAVLEGL
jgi:hypothetical protein